MTLLDQLIEKTRKETDDLDRQLKIICDEIQKENDNGINDPNLFLCIEVPGNSKNEIRFLCLERILRKKFCLSLWVKNINTNSIKRFMVWDINETDLNKILSSFSDKLLFLRGD